MIKQNMDLTGRPVFIHVLPSKNEGDLSPLYSYPPQEIEDSINPGGPS